MLLWPLYTSLCFHVGQGSLVLVDYKLPLLQFIASGLAMTFKGIQDVSCAGTIITCETHILYVCHVCLNWPRLYALRDRFSGLFLQCHACDLAFIPSAFRTWGSHTAGYPLSSSNQVPSSGCLVPSWSLYAWEYAVHLFSSHWAEGPETVTSQLGDYQAFPWRQGWPFPLRTPTGTNI